MKKRGAVASNNCDMSPRFRGGVSFPFQKLDLTVQTEKESKQHWKSFSGLSHFFLIRLSRFCSSRKQRQRAFCCLCVLVLGLYWSYHRTIFGSPYSFRGGRFGLYVDSKVRSRVYDETLLQRQSRLQSLGIQMPTHSLSNGALVQTLTKAAQRENSLHNLTYQASEWEESCSLWRNNTRNSGPVLKLPSRIPNVILQPTEWIKPIRGASGNVILFDKEDMRRTILHFCRSLEEAYRSASNSDRIYIWALCSLYQFGGYFVADHVRDLTHVSDTEDEQLSHILLEESKPCMARGAVVFAQSTSQLASNQTKTGKDNLDFCLFAVSPRHSYVKSLMYDIKGLQNTTSPAELLSTILDTDSRNKLESQGSTTLLHKGDSIYVTIENSLADSTTNAGQALPQQQSKMTVTIEEAKNTPEPVKELKTPTKEVMKRLGVIPSWLCTRCLRAPYYGSFSACKLPCPRNMKEFFCVSPINSKRKEVTVEVSVSRPPAQKAIDDGIRRHGRIPRIVHQTWWDEITSDRYPDLARLQNTWKTSGWEYRFYTDQSARDYIVKHYPKRFVDAFDALVPGAYKADFFRYLVLLRDGGVYADVDVKLDANLDTFITPDMSFFAPLDVVADYADENFCLWNGFMGSMPGHIFLVRVVERVLTFVLNRADIYDIERDICHSATEDDMEVWKPRSGFDLLLCGPCALGMAVNDVLGHSYMLTRYNPGWLPPFDESTLLKQKFSPDHGDALILAADTADHGAFRFTDVDRNMMVATTNLPDVSKTALASTRLPAQVRPRLSNRQPHYSITTGYEEPWGALGVYADKLSNNEDINLKLLYRHE